MRPTTTTIVLALALTAGCGAAASPSASIPTVGAEATATEQRPLIAWRVTSADGHESTLLGTFHLGVDLDDALPAPHDAHLNDARIVILEMDTANLNPAAVAPLAVLPPDQQLSALLGDELFAAVQSRLQMPVERLERLRPWVAVSVMMVSELSAHDEGEPNGAPGADGEQPTSLDIQLGERAAALGMAISGLETLPEQAALMNSIPLEGHLEYLRSIVQVDGEAEGEHERVATVQEMREAYLSGDLVALESFVIDPEKVAAAPDFFERMLFARNDAWLLKLRPELDAGGVFCAVGAGHLLGDRGLLALLEAAGYSVQRLSGPPLH